MSESTVPFEPFPATLTTPRLTLILHDSSPAHYACLISCFNAPSALKYLGDWNIHTQADVDALFAGTMLQRKLFPGHENDTGYISQGCHYHIAPRPGNLGEGVLVGGVSIAQRGDDVPPDIGWALLDEYQGAGYATEAAAELLRYAREHAGIKEIIAWPNLENAGSVRVAERIGMVRGGQVLDKDTGKPQLVYILPGTKWEDETIKEMGHKRS